MRKREVIELRQIIDRVGWSSTSMGHQQGIVDKRDYENTPESESMAYLISLYSTYLGGLDGSAHEAVGSISQCNGEYERRPSRSRIRFGKRA